MVAVARSRKVRPADVAADTKRNFIPMVKNTYAQSYPPTSILYTEPWRQLSIGRQATTRPPSFSIEEGDPVMMAIEYGHRDSGHSAYQGGPRVRVPFICAVNEKEPGGDWDTASSGYEEQLCRRSNFVATLQTPCPSTRRSTNYPIPSVGAIISDNVLVCRGPPDGYAKLDAWYDLPVVSIAAVRRPKLKDNGTTFSFTEEYEDIWKKMRGALCVCLHHGYDRIVIGDFGLGRSHRNPPQVLAEMWRDLFLFDPEIRGQFTYVVFCFEDANQSTHGFILDDIAKSEKKRNKSSREPTHASSAYDITDFDIFQHTFSRAEIQRVITQPDPRYGLHMITS